MPVTAKLSRKFYETFGDDIANELVEWFNQVDATYRADLKELNELNFARFDAKLEQRLAEQDARWGARLGRLEMKLDKRLTEVEHRLTQLRTDLTAEFNTGLAQQKAELNTGLARQKAELNTGLARHKAELTRLMFRFWLGTLVPLAGLIVALHTLLP